MGPKLVHANGNLYKTCIYMYMYKETLHKESLLHSERGLQTGVDNNIAFK